jgi:hypothetical protein
MPYKWDNERMERAFFFLLIPFVLGLLLAALLGAARTRSARLMLFWIGLVLVNSATAVILFAVFAVSRLSGSIPPGPGEVFGPLAIPILMIGLMDGIFIVLNRRVKQRTG